MEGGDADAEAEEHALDLVVEAFVDGQAATGFCQEIHDGGLGAGVFLFEGHAGAEFCDGFFGDLLVGEDEVGFWDFVLRAGEGFGKGAVVGENY